MSQDEQAETSREPLADEIPSILISCAFPERLIATKIKTFLTDAGYDVSLDASETTGGRSGNAHNRKPSKERQRLVLLLSPASMPFQKEIHRKWLSFDRERKPIYPIYIQDCKIPNRLRAYQYIDARANFEEALNRLLLAFQSGFALPKPVAAAEKIDIVDDAKTGLRSLEEAQQKLLEAMRDPIGNVVLSLSQARSVSEHDPRDLIQYWLGPVVEWSQPRHYLDQRFVNLTLLLDREHENDGQRWRRVEEFRFNDLRDVLRNREESALVLLGAPGSGKSTLLRRLQLDHCVDRLMDEADEISFFIQLNGYRLNADGELLSPREWLCSQWAARYPRLPRLENFLRRGRALLLLDALNEMPHKNAQDFRRLVGLWRTFTQEAGREGNRIVFSCRGLDYSAPLSSPELRVPQIEAQPMNAAQMREFLRAYCPAHQERVWKQLEGSPQFELFQTPFFLKLLCDQVETVGKTPKGRAALFTGFVRESLKRELNSKIFQSGELISDLDRQKLAQNKWRSQHELPEHGELISKLSHLAYSMQERSLETEGAQVRISYQDACALTGNANILLAGEALNILDRDVATHEISFAHQLLQEYFAARRLARKPKPELVSIEWLARKVSPTLSEILNMIAEGDPLPPLAQTGWEETTLTAAPMAKDPQNFIRLLMSYNLTVAARCAATTEIKIGDNLKNEVRKSLIDRTRNMKADLRARIAAGEALGMLGEPRFVRMKGPHGNYLLPPLAQIPGGVYPMGEDQSDHEFEKPAHRLEFPPFRIGRFPITNMEYKYFIDAGGYNTPQWWDTGDARAWLRWDASVTEDVKGRLRNNRKTILGWGEDHIRDLVKQNRWSEEQAENWIKWCNWTDEEFDAQLEVWYPEDKFYRQPEYWDDTRFNKPLQPVIGLTWYEARAYCNWLTANAATAHQYYRLPTEVEFEAAARGPNGRTFPYGDAFDSSRSNTFETHVRRTTPVGVFDNASPEGVFDLSGNASTWTLSIFDPEKFSYPYQKGDGREDAHRAGADRVLRGGSWLDDHRRAHAASRGKGHPSDRNIATGFRVVLVDAPSAD
jgi:formylglycine-generating enzyme required for sulfatase activity